MSMAVALSEREAGDIIRRIISLEEGVKDLRSEVRGLDGKVDGILSRFDQIDGGLKVAIWASGFIGAVGMFALTKIAPLFLGFLPKV